MAFQMVEYGTLKKSILQSIDTLLKYHGVREASSLKDKSRRIQVYFLSNIIDTLEKPSDKSENTKRQILNAAAYFIHIKIKESYENSTFAYFQNVTNSDFFNSLTTALGLRDLVNYPTDSQTFDLYQSLCLFMKSEVYHENGLEKGFKVNHPFSTIKGYMVEEDIKLLLKKLLALEFNALDAATKVHQEKGSEKASLNGVCLHTQLPVSNNVIVEYKATNKKSVTLFTFEHKSNSEEAFEEAEDADVSRTNGI